MMSHPSLKYPDPRLENRKCCCTPVEQVRDRNGEIVVLWCTKCNWTHDLRSDEEMPRIEQYDMEKMQGLIDDLLNPEALGHSVTAEVRDRARECKGLRRSETTQSERRSRSNLNT
jgi:hypothetical protein